MSGANFFAVAIFWGNGVTLTVSDSQGDSPTGLTAAYAGGPQGNIYYFQNVVGVSGETFSASAGNGYPGACVLGFSNMAISGVYESGTQVSASSNSPGSATPTYGNSNVFVALTEYGGTWTGLTINSGFLGVNYISYAGGTTYGCGAAYLIQSGTTSQNPTWTYTPSVTGSSMQAVFQGAH
jgi:hypothetical protein